ncbi:hypothetical protein GCM10022416_01990 [Actinomadura keratinilytica]|uniref:Uncharacterized protein n=1 Tax=Actinomadura keratinilytica TaxID=547461 RepID=A0ABP7XX26_9ACTN
MFYFGGGAADGGTSRPPRAPAGTAGPRRTAGRTPPALRATRIPTPPESTESAPPVTKPNDVRYVGSRTFRRMMEGGGRRDLAPGPPLERVRVPVPRNREPTGK